MPGLVYFNDKRLACLLFLVVEHGEIEVDELQVAGRRRVVSSLQLAVEPFRHLTHACMDLHTHLRDLRLHGT